MKLEIIEYEGENPTILTNVLKVFYNYVTEEAIVYIESGEKYTYPRNSFYLMQML